MALLLLCCPRSVRCKQAPLQIHAPMAAPRSVEPKAATIPRIIHQSWKTKEVPERFREWQVRLQRDRVNNVLLTAPHTHFQRHLYAPMSPHDASVIHWRIYQGFGSSSFAVATSLWVFWASAYAAVSQGQRLMHISALGFMTPRDLWSVAVLCVCCRPRGSGCILTGSTASGQTTRTSAPPCPGALPAAQPVAVTFNLHVYVHDSLFLYTRTHPGMHINCVSMRAGLIRRAWLLVLAGS